MRRPFRFPLWIAPLAVLVFTFGLLFWKPASLEDQGVVLPVESLGAGKIGKVDVPVPASLSADAAPAAQARQGEALPDLDVRTHGKTVSAAAMKPSRLQAVKSLQQRVPGVKVDFDPVTGSPKWIGSTQRLLTGPQQELAAADADAPIRRFIEANREIFGHGPEVLDSARRVTDYTTSRSQTRKAVWHQQLDGIDIFEAVFQANLSAKSELVNVGSHLVADPGAATGGTDRKALASAPPVPAEAAVAAAGRSVGEKTTAESVRATSAPAPQPDRRQQFRAALLTDADARLVWVPMNENNLQLAWDVTLTSRSRGEMYRVLVDVQTGGVLVRQALTAYISPATYRVFTKESPTPFSPGHESPSSLQPLPVERQVFSLEALNLTASPEGWIPDGTTITTGNNADAYTDTDNNNVADLPRTDGTAARNFDFPLNLANEPATQKEASVTQLFYWTNFAHDRLYELGFTEAAGNFQLNNFGRGGLANDPVNAEAQDGSGTNNANFSTPVDGGRGRMQMFNWTGPTPDRDGSFEAEVVLHEYCHGLSNRLVGGPSVTISALASRGMGEGWSDFYGQALTAEASDNPHGNWARAGYSRYQSSGWFSENYYYGARRYSYSTDMLKNPHTFRDIDPNLVDWHTAVPRNPLFAATQDASQVHYVGTIWCTMLWDMRANLILKHGFQTGNERAMFLVAEGMKLAPANPNLVQARDGIVQATMVNHPQDMGEVWTAFAKRGLGDGATAPASTTTTGVTESYKVPDALEISDRSGWNIHGSLGGSFSPAAQVLTLTNDGSTNLSWQVNPGAVWLSASPATGQLAPGAQVQVTLNTQASTAPSGFHSTNVVFENQVTGFKQPVGVRLYVRPPVAYDFPLDSQPEGWTMTGEWSYGSPLGSAGTVGNPDPAAGATGGKVFGANLAGAYGTAVSGPFYLTTAPLNLQARKNTRLSFRRWLNTASLTGTRVTVEVATNGSNWREVYVNPSTAVTDNVWQTLEYDISSIADRQPAVQVRWSYQVLSGTAAYTGWNLDDIQVLGEPTVYSSLAFAADTVPENGSPVTATLSLSTALPQPMEVVLSSSAPSVASVPGSVTLAAGQLSQTFSITPQDNALLDGTRSVMVSAAAPGLAGAAKALLVTDDESAVLTLSASPALDEGQAATAALSVSRAPDRDVVVEIVSSDPILSAPASVILPAGSSAPIVFPLSVVDDALATGNKSVTLTARVAGWTNHPAFITIRDDESPTLVLTGPASVAEGDGPQSYTLAANTLHTSPVNVTLSSSDLTEGTVPATVTLPAGVSEVSFLMQVVDDGELDGPRPVTLTAAAAGYASANRQVVVQDNDVSSYSFAAIASPQWRNQPVPVTVTAHDVAGNLITNHTGSVSLTSTSSSGPVPFTPAVISGFSGGAASEGVIFTEVAQNIVLTATDGNGKTGSSNAFAIQPVVHHSFAWSGLPVSIRVDEAFTAGVRAVDDQGITATGYQENTVVEAWMGTYDGTIGSTGSTTTTTAVFNTAAHESRTQLLYTAAELGSRERWLGAFNFSSVSVTTQPLLNFTMRVKHTDKTSFEGSGWEDGGWTTIYSSSLSIGQTYLPFIKPFLYNGAQNLIVDISFDNASTSSPAVFRTVETAGRAQSATANGNASGAPLSWSATNGPQPAASNQLPVLLFYEAMSYGPVPSSPVVFASGQATVKAYAPMSSNSTLWLLARAASGVEGFSNRVAVSSAPASTFGTALVFSDSFESGTLSSAWTATKSGATARTLVTSANLPKTGNYHLTMDTTSTATGTFARNSPTLTLDLTGRKNVSVEWMAKKFLDENHAAPLTGPEETLPDTANYDGVAISQDGVTWAEVSSLTLAPASYGTAVTRVFLDPVMQKLGWTYNSTFRIRFSQYDDQAIPNDGIAIDDVAVRAEGTNVVSLTVPPNIAEGASLVQGTASVAVAPAAPLVVSLSSNAPAILEVPSAVMIPAGQTSATFTLNAPQNRYADLGKPAVITATLSGYTTSYTHTRVLDDERPGIWLSLPASLTEGGSSAQGTAQFSQRPVVSFRTFFSSGDTSEASVSTYVTVPVGGTPTFTVTPINDTLLDGDQTVEVTARVAGMTDGKASLVVTDNESRQLVVSLSVAEMREGASPISGTVTLSGSRPVETVVTLTSSHPGRLQVPLTTIIPAGSLSASFMVQAVDDDELKGAQEVLLTLKAEGLLDGQAMLRVVDNEPHALEISALDPQLTRHASYPLTIQAVDDNGDVVPYNGTVTLAARAGETPLALSSGPSATFVSGVWMGSFAVGGTAAEARLTAVSSSGATGTSEGFSVQPGGEAERLVFAPVASPQNAAAAVTFQIHAADAAGVRVAGGVGPVAVALVSSSGQVLAQTQVSLVEGIAAGSVTAGGEIGAVRLRATGLGLAGESAVFDIAGRRAFPEAARLTLFEDGFEAAAFKPEWQITGTGPHRTQVTGYGSPRGLQHMLMDAAGSPAAFARNEATLTLDLSGMEEVSLKFWMKEFGDEDHSVSFPVTNGGNFDGVAISADGVKWHEVQGLRTSQGITASYKEFTVDLDAAVRQFQLSYTGAFKIRFNHYDDTAVASDGFAFDDISVTARQKAVVALQLPGEIAEGGSATGWVSLASARGTDTVVTLASDRSGRLLLPSSVTLPAGSVGPVSFTLALAEDNLLTGPLTADVQATMLGYKPQTASMRLLDNELPSPMQLSFSGPLVEGGGSVEGVLRLTVPPVFAVTAQLAYSSVASVNGPTSVFIPAGASQVMFQVSLPQNEIILEPDVVVSAVINSGVTHQTLPVVDNDRDRELGLWRLPIVLESGPSSQIWVNLTWGKVAGRPITVWLSSSDPASLKVSPTVVIPAGANSAPGTQEPVDNLLQDGARDVTLTVKAAGLPTWGYTTTVQDDELHHLAIINHLATQNIQTPFNVELRAQTIDNTNVPFHEPLVLTAVADGVTLPSTLTSSVSPVRFVNGQFQGTVTLPVAARNVVFKVEAGGLTATSNSFDVAGPAVRLVWGKLAVNEMSSAPVNVTLMGQDANGAAPAPVVGTASLSLAPVMSSALTIGNNSVASSAAMDRSQSDFRTQILYRNLEMGAARKIGSLAVNAQSGSTSAYSNLTVRMKHTSKQSLDGSLTWDNAGWVTVWSGNRTFGSAGWNTLPLTTPFEYNGSDSLLVEISSDNSSASGSVMLWSDTTGQDVTVVSAAASTGGAPTGWSGSAPALRFLPVRPQIRFMTAPPAVTVSPVATGAFDSLGVWSGQVRVYGTPPLSVRLQAVTGGGLAGVSEPVHLRLDAPVLEAEPAATGGLVNTLAWSGPSFPRYTLEWAANPQFAGATSVADLQTGSRVVDGLEDGKLYYYRVRGFDGGSHAPVVDQWLQAAGEDFATGTADGAHVWQAQEEVVLAKAASTNAANGENFDAAGTGWSSTVLPFASGPLSRLAVPSGPAATPQLPVNSGGDSVALVGNASGSARTLVLTSAEAEGQLEDGSAEAFLFPQALSSSHGAGLLLRAGLSSGGDLRAYAAMASFLGTSCNVTLQLLMDGLPNQILATVPGFSFATTDNVKVRLSATGSEIKVTVWKVTVVDGAIQEVLMGEGTAENKVLGLGRAGLYCPATYRGCYFDDAVITRAVPEYRAAGSITGPVIRPEDLQRWRELGYQVHTPPGTLVSVDVLDGGGGLLAAGVSSGTDLSSLPALAGQKALRLRARLSTSDPGVTPALLAWSVAYESISSTPSGSVWSGVQSSRQDNTPPEIQASRYIAGRIRGTAIDSGSGVETVSVNGTNASWPLYAWGVDAASLPEGENTVVVTATDRAVPPNSRTASFAVYRILSPETDPDGNGLSSLQEHALAIPAGSSSPHAKLPKAGIYRDPATGRRFLTLEYRRPLQRSGLKYEVQMSQDLVLWERAAIFQVLEEVVTPNADGLSETVQVRIPAGEDMEPSGFMRLQIELQ